MLNRPVSEKILITLLAIFPLGVLIISSWMSACLFLSAAMSIYLLVKSNKQSNQLDCSKVNPRWVKLTVLMFVAPFLTILITQALRQNWHISDFDSPSRFLLAIPVFYVVWKKDLPLAKYWQYVFPLMLLVTLVAIPFLPKTGWVALIPDRLSTYFVNQIIFGRICLTFGLLSLLSINLVGKDRWFVILFKVLGTALGFYLSIKSEARSGWLAIPIIFFFFLWINGPKNKIVSTLVASLISVVVLGSIYQSSPKVQTRIAEAVSDISSYKMYEMNPDTSIGIRISSARMAWYYFNLRPLSGWGDKGFKDHINDAEISVYASEFTRNHPFAGFHNEFTNSAVKSGIWGIISTTLLFLVPLAFFISAWRKNIAPRLAAIGAAYVLCELISSMTLEVFDLKFTTSLYALLVACLMGSIFAAISKTKTTS